MSDTPPPIGGSRSGSIEQRVTWAELFFDLVWVLAVTEIAGVLAQAHSVGELGKTLILLVPLWWGWVGATLLGNVSGAALEGARGRLLLFALAGCGLAMSVAAPHAYDQSGLLFAASYVVLRALLWLAMRRRGVSPGFRWDPFTIDFLVAGPLFLLGGVVGGPWRITLWALAALIDVLSPTLGRRGMQHLQFETAHLPERFGLFVIIALGETVVAIGVQAASADELGATTLGTLGIAFALIVALWWTYFAYGAQAVRYSLQSDPTQARIVRDVFSYAHLIYVTAIICVAVGLKKLLADPLSVPDGLPELLLAPGVGLYLLGFCFARWRMFGAAAVPRFTVAILCFAIAALAPLLVQLLVTAVVTVLVVLVNAVEAWIVETGRPLPLLHLPRRTSAP